MAFEPETYVGPFHELLGLDVESAADGTAVVSLELTHEHSSLHQTTVAQGGVVFTLADFCGGLALASVADEQIPIPTLDMRIDYLRPATTDLRATGEVLRFGGQSGVTRVDVEDVEGRSVATATGVFRTNSLGPDAPWSARE